MPNQEKPILIVEDDLALSGSIVTMLTTAHYAPVAVVGTREATFKIKNQKFSMIILDLRLGQESGEDVLEFIRQRPDHGNQATPVLIVSGVLDRETLQRLAGNVQGALVKPFDMNDLQKQVHRLAGPGAA
jgi:DNA-binding response OmpR family regulator